MSTKIDINKLVKDFDAGQSSTRAVDHIHLAVEPGELFFLLGPSGCGKTTLLRMIAGFIDPTQGSIAFNNKDVTHAPPNKRNTGMVFQSYALWPHMTVQANVEFGLSIRKIPKDQRTTRALKALVDVQMDAYAPRKPNQLSGGQQQRVALARALVITPDVLLLDEPLSNLDAKLRIELRSEIRRICKDAGITTVYVTHDQKEALSMADRIAILKLGKVIQIGTPTELYRTPRSRFVAEFLGETNFIPGTIAESTSGKTLIKTKLGTLASTHPINLPKDSTVTCSIRPETLRVINDDSSKNQHNMLSCKHLSTTYLGEIAQHVVCAGEDVELRAAVLNPSRSDLREPGASVQLAVAEDDVVVIPAT